MSLAPPTINFQINVIIKKSKNKQFTQHCQIVSRYTKSLRGVQHVGRHTHELAGQPPTTALT